MSIQDALFIAFVAPAVVIMWTIAAAIVYYAYIEITK